uniref:THO complex 1 n=1 Tax=Oncorhynchus mykiss TaxID=8022 RepID=A0A8C7SKY2_ONCMY
MAITQVHLVLGAIKGHYKICSFVTQHKATDVSSFEGTRNFHADCRNVLTDVVNSLVHAGICSATTPFLLLGDVLDCLPLYQCDKVFSFVEENVSTWKSNSFYTAGKNYLLRMCNDLLRRLSKSQNTVFCGRIQLFLARLFPLSEKSGLNLQSQFNLDNIIVFNKNEQESTLGQKPTEEEDGMEVEEGEMGNLVKFWTLQDYFRNPVQCYEKFSWMTFLKTVFRSFKLDDMQASKKKLEELRTAGGDHVYFAKFLTSEKLSDSNFRRHILLQYLILSQYLQGTGQVQKVRWPKKMAPVPHHHSLCQVECSLIQFSSKRCNSEFIL